MGCRMSVKVQGEHGDYSLEQDKRFHQDILDFEHRYQGQYNENIMGSIFGDLLEKAIYGRKTISLKWTKV